MILHVLRGLFVLLMGAAGWFYLRLSWLTLLVALAVAVLFVSIDVLAARRKLAVFAGTLFGLLVGILIAFGLSFVIQLLIDQVLEQMPAYLGRQFRDEGGPQFLKLIVALVTCYLTVSFTLQTKDDFRFIIPYVEFKKDARGARPFLVDTSALIDGRIADVAQTGMIGGQLVVPQFVLDELQAVADSGDRAKRNRGRRGLDVLAKLRNGSRVDVLLYAVNDAPGAADKPVDQRLIDLAGELNGRVLTTDYNLNKVAAVHGVDVVNLNELANALKPVVLPGERMRVRLVKPGESAGQGVGYLDDGTMVVVEHGRPLLNETVDITVTSALQTNAGRMVFGRLATAEVTSTGLAGSGLKDGAAAVDGAKAGPDGADVGTTTGRRASPGAKVEPAA
jgi:uncharacterized protein YacL